MKIKRPLFIIALSILVVIYAINTMPGSIVYASLALFALFTIIHRFTRNKYTGHMVLFLLAAVAGLFYFRYYTLQLSAGITELEGYGQDTLLTGEVTADGRSYVSTYYIIKADTVNGEKTSNFKVLLYSADTYYPGDSVELYGKYKSFTPTSNYMYNYGRGVFGYFYADKVEILTEISSFTKVFSNIRTALLDKARRIFAYDVVPVAVAMGIGDKSLLEGNTVNAFNFTGLSHALVVSGAHVGFIMLVLNGLLHFVPVKKKLKNIVSSILIFVFMGIVGFTPSIIRAGVLVIAMTLGRNLFLEIDNYTVLALIILFTLLSNPYTATNASLLLSYTAYFGVIHAADISRERNYNDVITSLLMTVFAVLYTSPVMAILGFDTTLLSPIFNLLLSPVIMAVCVLSFFLPVFSFVPVIGDLLILALADVNEVLIRLLLAVTDFAENNLAFAMVDLGTDGMKVVIFSALIAVIIAFIQFENKYIRRIFIMAVPITAFLCYNYLNRDVVTVQVFDGSSEPSYVISYKDENYLVAAENINIRRFDSVMNTLNIETFDEIVICSKEAPDADFYSQYTNNLKIKLSDGEYTSDIYTVYSDRDNRKYRYFIQVGETRIGFSHNKADMTGLDLDFYFFGADTPRDISADNYYYFYPVIKKNIDITREKQAVELYGNLTVKINLSTGQYHVVEDVKNFGGGI